MDEYISQFKNHIVTDASNMSNHVSKQLKLFKGDQDKFNLDPQSLNQFLDLTENVVRSLYIFKLDKSCSSDSLYSHGIYITFEGSVPRRQVKRFLQFALSKLFNRGQVTSDFVGIKPHIPQGQSIFDYLLSLYREPRNLLVYVASGRDVLAYDTPDMCQLNHQVVNGLLQLMRNITSKVFDNIMSLTSLYEGTTMHRLMSMDFRTYYHFMRHLTFKGLVQQILNESHSIALQDSQFSPEQIQQLSSPLCRQNVVLFLMNDTTLKRVQEVIARGFGFECIHPSPLADVASCTARNHDVFDVIHFDSRFLFSLLMCARWFAKFYSRQDCVGSLGDRSNLILYGQSGVGKSLILSVLSSNVQTYKFITTSKFQSPDIMSSSLISIDEFEVDCLVTNAYKALFDINSSIKIDFKNMHPSNVSKDVPIVASTNDELFTTLQSLPQRKLKCNQSSVDAALRRLYAVPFKGPRYNKAHGSISDTHRFYELLHQYNGRFMNEQDLLDRLFNFFVAFALIQKDVNFNWVNDPLFTSYGTQCVKHLNDTLFGRLYSRNRVKIDRLLSDMEALMSVADLNDTEYCSRVAMNAGVLEQSVQRFLATANKKNRDLQTILEDTTIPQPLKVYYTKDVASNRWDDESEGTINETVTHSRWVTDMTLPFSLESDEEDEGPPTNQLIKLSGLEAFFGKTL